MSGAVDKRERIRPFGSEDGDEKLVKFYVSKAQMEPLAIANKTVIWHPISISVWVALSLVLIQLIDLWPTPTEALGKLGYLRPLPIMAFSFIPIMSTIDWYNRQDFVQEAEDALKRPGMRRIQEHYLLSPSSGLWIFEYDQELIGICALDASTPNASSLSNNQSNRKPKENTSERAIIRHFYINEKYRSVSIQDDLLEFAIENAFKKSEKVKFVEMTPPVLSSYINKALVWLDFAAEPGQGKTMGILGWSSLKFVLSREDWEKRRRI